MNEPGISEIQVLAFNITSCLGCVLKFYKINHQGMANGNKRARACVLPS